MKHLHQIFLKISGICILIKNNSLKIHRLTLVEIELKQWPKTTLCCSTKSICALVEALRFEKLE